MRSQRKDSGEATGFHNNSGKRTCGSNDKQLEHSSFQDHENYDQIHCRKKPFIPKSRAKDYSESRKEHRPANYDGGVDHEDGKADFRLSGSLASESNMRNGVALIYTEPPESRKPGRKWRLYTFKNEKIIEEPLHLEQSCYIFGREHRVADMLINHPSCSKQHAALQFRNTSKYGIEKIRPYLIDLGSTNGTFLNGEKLESERYYELLENDVVKFGNSSREFVLLRER